VLIGDIRYDESHGSDHRSVVNFLPDFRQMIVRGGATVPMMEFLSDRSGPVVRVRTTADQVVLLNSKPFPVSPGAPFALAASFQDLLPTNMYGILTVIWLDDQGRGGDRENIVLRPTPSVLATLKTDENGRFVRNDSRVPNERSVRLYISAREQAGIRAIPLRELH
jgi:hypothetical protein